MLEWDDSPPPPAGALAHGGPGVSHGSEASSAVLGPFWIKPAPGACSPWPGASQPLRPILLGSALLLPHLFHFCLTPTQKSPFLRWLAGGGDVREGFSLFSLIPSPSTSLLPGGPAGVMVTHPNAEV